MHLDSFSNAHLVCNSLLLSTQAGQTMKGLAKAEETYLHLCPESPILVTQTRAGILITCPDGLLKSLRCPSTVISNFSCPFEEPLHPSQGALLLDSKTILALTATGKVSSWEVRKNNCTKKTDFEHLGDDIK